MSEVEIIDTKTELISMAKEYKVSDETSLSLAELYKPFKEAAQIWEQQALEIVVTDIDDKKTMSEAHDLRMQSVKKRGQLEKLRKAKKENAKSECNAIDGLARLIRESLQKSEAHLQEQEDFAKRERARLEAERQREIDRLKDERSAVLDEYGYDYSFMMLGEMPDEAFASCLQTAKDAHEKRKRDAEEKAEADRRAAEEASKAEAERKAKEAAERKRIEEENARLKAEQEAKEAELQKEREDREKERKALEAKQAAERKKAEAAEKKRKAEAAKKLKAEQEAKAAAEAEAKRLREAEEKRQREEQERIEAEEAERQKALQADDGAKLDALVLHIQEIELKSEPGQELLETIADMISDFTDSI